MRQWMKRFLGGGRSSGEPSNVPESPHPIASVPAPAISQPKPNPIQPPAPPPENYVVKKSRLSVGRGPHNDIVVADAALSRTHMYILLEDDGRARIVDTLTPNGVWIVGPGGNVRVDREALVHIDEPIQLGETRTTVGALLRLRDDYVDIFISYAREDEALASELDDALVAHGWKPWRDNRIGVARQYDGVIEERLRAARCVIVLWSKHSVASQWVVTEASFGFDKGNLVPVFLQTVEPPLMFRRTQGCFVTGDNSAKRAEQSLQLMAKLEELIGRPNGR